MQPKKRYYFHGDVVDGSTQVYCAQRDDVVDVAHFYDMEIHPPSRLSDYDRYLRSRKTWNRRDSPLRQHYFRPTPARNIFS